MFPKWVPSDKAVFIAGGAHKSMRLDAPSFLRETNLGKVASSADLFAEARDADKAGLRKLKELGESIEFHTLGK